MLAIVFMVVFGAVSLLTWELLRPKERVIERRLAINEPVHTRERQLSGSFLSRNVRPWVQRGGRRLSALLPQNFVRRIDSLLHMADEPWSLSGFLATWALVAAASVGLFAWFVASRDGITAVQVFVLAVGVLPLPVMMPYVVLRRRVRKRQQSIVRALPDAMDLMVTCVEAGMGVDAAFALVTERTTGPLSETLALYLRQVALGRSRRDALAFVAQRTGVQDLIGLSNAIIQGEELGTSMGDVMRRQSEDLRALRAQRARERAQRAPVLMTIPLVLFFLPAMGAVIVVPAILNLVEFVQDL